MKTKKNSKSLTTFKMIMVLLVISLLIVAFSSCGKTKNSEVAQTEMALLLPPPPPPSEASEPEPYTAVEEMPVFPGGDAALLKFIGDSTKYPEVSKLNGTQGRVIVRFCVTEKGTINRISIIQGVSAELDAEAMRVVSKLLAFKPGKQGGKEVPVWYNVPISYTLK